MTKTKKRETSKRKRRRAISLMVLIVLLFVFFVAFVHSWKKKKKNGDDDRDHKSNAKVELKKHSAKIEKKKTLMNPTIPRRSLAEGLLLNTFNTDVGFLRTFLNNNQTNSTTSTLTTNSSATTDNATNVVVDKFISALKKNSILYRLSNADDTNTIYNEDINQGKFIETNFPLARLKVVERCEPRCLFRSTGGFGLLPRSSVSANPNWNSLRNRIEATTENVREVLADFVEYYVLDDQDTSGFQIYNSNLFGQRDDVAFNAMNARTSSVMDLIRGGEEKDVIRKAMVLGREIKL